MKVKNESDQVMVTWTRPMLERFKKAYALSIEGKPIARGDGDDTFLFDDMVFVNAYAKYLIEYLEGVLT